jgi:hypothetical protein
MMKRVMGLDGVYSVGLAPSMMPVWGAAPVMLPPEAAAPALATNSMSKVDMLAASYARSRPGEVTVRWKAGKAGGDLGKVGAE